MKFRYALFSCAIALSAHATAWAGDLVVIRHGNSQHNLSHEYNSNPEHEKYRVSCLTPLGVKQAVKTAKKLLSDGYSDDNIAEVVVSPLPRARQTAKVLIKQGLFDASKVRIDPRLTEVNAGDREGLSTDIFNEDHWERHDADRYNGETNNQVKSRVLALYDETAEAFENDENKHVLYITHGVTIYELIDQIKGERIRMQTAETMVLPLEKTRA